ncbi:hypothetical protein O1611_g3410 [Lasiodiplodia mahajangana]|uniref:Uncharacterized protein n=1 Tax=Lasiodiplodia mahajangana TaxID=1108764 RepID=A0ACC2JRW6_9PEZI|nr:hypothetical protein O1611_g3410 [Lasiodiplodia mahajangana]
MSRQPRFQASSAGALQTNLAIKTNNYNSGTTPRQHVNSEEKLQAAKNEMKALRNGMEAMASDLLEARHEARVAHEAKEQLELKCTKLSQEVESLHAALESERRRQGKERQAQAREILEQHSQQQLLVNNKMASREMQFDSSQKTRESQADDIEKLHKLVKFYKGNSERLSAEVQQLKERSKRH